MSAIWGSANVTAKRQNGKRVALDSVLASFVILTFEINSKKSWFVFEFFVPLNCQ